MTAQRFWFVGTTLAIVFSGWAFVVPASHAQEKSTVEKLDETKAPKPVMHALGARFPKSAIRKVTRKKEGQDIVYDIEFKVADRKCEADIKESGAFVNFEREVAASALPAAARKAVEAKYPKSTLKEAMEITEVS